MLILSLKLVHVLLCQRLPLARWASLIAVAPHCARSSRCIDKLRLLEPAGPLLLALWTSDLLHQRDRGGIVERGGLVASVRGKWSWRDGTTVAGDG